MAIEAIKQLAVKGDRHIAGYQLRDVKLQTALIIPATSSGVEIQFCVHQAHDASNKDVAWSDFKLWAYIDGQWVEICSGSARVELEITTSEIHGEKEERERREYNYSSFMDISQQCIHPVDSDHLYGFLRSCGYEFGPSFQSITNGTFFETKAAADIKVFQWDDTVSVNPRQPHIVHPCTLDGLLQLPIVTFTSGGTKKTSTIVPALVRNMWISNSGVNWPKNDIVSATAELLSSDNRGVEVQIIAVSEGNICVRMEGVRFAFVTGSNSVEEAEPEKHTLWNLGWKPDLDMLDKKQLQTLCASQTSHTDEPILFYDNLTFLLFAFLFRMERKIVLADLPPLPFHLQMYLAWARRQLQTYHIDIESDWEVRALDHEYFNALCETIENTNAQGKVYVTVGRNLVKIFRSEVNPLELLFQSGILEDLYQELSDMPNAFRSLDKYLIAYSHKYPDSRYLEIGAGTGGSTGNVLNALMNHGDPLSTPASYSDYTFTDISEAFFERGKEKFKNYQNMNFKRLDIEQAPSEQGFDSNTYDVIIAANVIHATKDLSVTLKHVSDLLRPGGRLILYEITNLAILRNGFTMGLLPGWWLSSEEYRQWGPCISESQWNKVFLQNGFTGVDLSFRDYEADSCHELSILITTKSDEQQIPKTFLNTLIVSEQALNSQQEFCSQLQTNLSASRALKCSILDISQTAAFPGDPGGIAIFTDEVYKPVLYNLDESRFSQLKQYLTKCGTVIWLTRTTSDGSSPPFFGMVDGLARVLRAENATVKFVTIAFDVSSNDFKYRAETVVRIVQQTLQASLEGYEPAYEERDGLLQVCRVRMADTTSDKIHIRSLPKISQEILWAESPPLRLTIGTPGILDTLHYVEDIGYAEPLGLDEVEIEVHAVGLNFKDCLIALGTVAGETLGNECSGIITRLGPECSGLNIGDRVCMSTVEAFKTYARSRRHCVCKLPSEVSFIEAAAVPTQFVTAWICVNVLGRLQSRDSILIHAGAGGTGQAAIQLAQHIGAEVFVTVGSNAKKELLMNEYGIPEDHILHSRDTTFVDPIMRMTSGRGVDVILNSLAGDSLFASWNCLARYGRFVEIGKKDILANSKLSMLKFNDNVTFSSFDGSTWMHDRPRETQMAIKTVLDMYCEGILHTARPLHVYGISDVSRAFRLLADGKSSGKAVLEVKPDAAVTVRIPHKPSLELHYILIEFDRPLCSKNPPTPFSVIKRT